MDLVEKLVDKLGTSVPPLMAESIVLFVLNALKAQLQTSIELGERNVITGESIWVILAPSGARKSSSINKIRSICREAEELIHNERILIHRRKIKAAEGDKDAPTPFFRQTWTSLSTVKGLTVDLNDFEMDDLGNSVMFIDEAITQMKEAGKDFNQVMDAIGILYESGKMDARSIGAEELRTKPVERLSVTTMIMGAAAPIYQDAKTRQQFLEVMITKFARRAFFISEAPVKHGLSEEEEVEKLMNSDFDLKSAEESLEVLGIIEWWLSEKEREMTVSESALRKYSTDIVRRQKILADSEYANLDRHNRPWRALKLASLYAFLDKSMVIEGRHYDKAITYADKMDLHLENFVKTAEAMPHERLRIMAEKTEFVPFSLMLKEKWIKTVDKAEDIVSAANVLDGYPLVEEAGGVRMVMPIEPPRTESGEITHTVAIKLIPSLNYMMQSLDKKEAKIRLAQTWCVDGYSDIQVTLGQLANLLGGLAPLTVDLGAAKVPAMLSYVIGGLREGRRGKDFVREETTSIVLDIDDGDETMNEVADRLDDYAGIIMTTSDKDNPYKFRIILELSKTINDVIDYTKLVAEIATELSLTHDRLGKAQMMYGYEDAKVRILEGEPFDPSTVIREMSAPKPERDFKVRSYADETIFHQHKRTKYLKKCYSAKTNRRNHLFLALQIMVNMGISKKGCYDTLEDLNNSIRDGKQEWYADNLMKQVEKKYAERENKYLSSVGN